MPIQYCSVTCHVQASVTARGRVDKGLLSGTGEEPLPCSCLLACKLSCLDLEISLPLPPITYPARSLALRGPFRR
jgi:hypothetical protein